MYYLDRLDDWIQKATEGVKGSLRYGWRTSSRSYPDKAIRGGGKVRVRRKIEGSKGSMVVGRRAGGYGRSKPNFYHVYSPEHTTRSGKNYAIKLGDKKVGRKLLRDFKLSTKSLDNGKVILQISKAEISKAVRKPVMRPGSVG